MERKKNEEYEESQQKVFGLKLYFAQKHNLKKIVYSTNFYLQFLSVAGYLKHSIDTANLNIQKYTNYNLIEIYINRLSITTQVFIEMYYLIMMSKKHHYFRKRRSIWQGHFLPSPLK